MRKASQGKRRIALLCKVVFIVVKHLERDALRIRGKIHRYFWNQVGSVEHISLPMLEDAIKKEFNCGDDRCVQTQIRLMQTEARIKIESRVKVWIKQLNNDHDV